MNEVIDMQATAVPAGAMVASATPSDLLRMAVAQGADLDRLERLLALQERWEANEARKAFVQAMTEFKRNPPEILKTKLVQFLDVKYMHATLGDVTAAVIEALARHDFSHRWDTQQPGDGRIVVHCIITHAKGHSETNTLMASPDVSGKKNAIQAIASAVTYLERYTLLSACGLATKDMEDDDGRVSGGAASAKKSGVIKPTDGAGRGLTQEIREFLQARAEAMIEFDAAGQPDRATVIWHDPANFADDDGQTDERVYLWSLLQRHSKLRAYIKDHPATDSKKSDPRFAAWEAAAPAQASTT